MPAPLVLPMAENMTTFTNFAEKVNQVSENKFKLEVSIIESKQTEKLAKMTKEMNNLKHELSQLKPKRGKRDAMKEAGRNSPKAKLTKCDSPREGNRENIEPNRRAKSSESMEKRAENERITNLHRRYTCKLGDESTLQVKKPLPGITKSKIR